MNRVIITGNLTRDPELRQTQSGTTICEISVAINEKTKDREKAIFVIVKSFGRTAETISKYFSKGKPIAIEGKLDYEEWKSKDGKNMSRITILCERFEFMGGDNKTVAPQETTRTAQATFDNDENIPF